MNRIYNSLLIVLLLLQCLYIPSCKQEKETNDWPSERLQNWLDYYDLSMEDFDEKDRFDRAYRVIYEFSLSEDDMYAPLYIYSEDSSRAIDIDSYHLVLERTDKGELFSPGREADMEAALIDLNKGVRKRLLFCGPSCVFEEAGFHPGGHVFVAGFAESETAYYPVIWYIDEDNGYIVIERASERDLPAAKIRYIPDRRLSGVIFWHQPEGLHLDVPL